SARAGADRALHRRRGARLPDRHGHRARPALSDAGTGHHQRPGSAARAVLVLADRAAAAALARARGRPPVLELMGAGAVWMFWYALRRPFGEGAAAFAATIMAFSPWSALFADRVWNPN